MPVPRTPAPLHRLGLPFRCWAPPLWAWAGWVAPAAAAALPLLTIERQDGRTYQGRPGEVTAEVLTLVIPAGPGSAELPFTAADILRLSWNDDAELAAAHQATAAGDPAAAAAWSSLWNRRIRLLPWADPQAWQIGREHLRSLAHQDRHAEAAGLARRLRPLAPDGPAQRELADAELAAIHALGLRAEAVLLADRWIAAEGRPVRSALGWRIRAELALAAHDPITARDTALAAIALASLPAPPHLAACWDLATAALDTLDQTAHADQLRREATAMLAPSDPPDLPSHD